jgi:threonine dehydratase
VQKLSIAATIAMPKATPFTEIVQTQGFGTRVILEGESVNDGVRFANNISAWEELVFVHP